MCERGWDGAHLGVTDDPSNAKRRAQRRWNSSNAQRRTVPSLKPTSSMGASDGDGHHVTERGAGLAPLEEVVGMAFNLHNNMWSINYPVFSPYENALWDNAYDDANFQFRFAIDFSSGSESA